ncbi:MAG: AAA family ATPase [Prosthecobacter sp.]
MITRIKIQNYRSFVDAEVNLRPFSLVVGANGSGKSNLLRFFLDSTFQAENVRTSERMLVKQDVWSKHQMHTKEHFGFEIIFEDGKSVTCTANKTNNGHFLYGTLPWKANEVPTFNIDPSKVSEVETIAPKAFIQGNGSGTAQVLDILKNGDREELFDRIEENFRRYVPEVEKLSLRSVENGKKQIQVREKGLKNPLPATALSEGTRLVLCILTILHQENPPPIILLEDIDRGLHPRLFEYMAPLMKDIAERHNINILATTHNPYLVDCFQDDKEAVIIVEKKDGASTLSTLVDRLKDLDYDKVDPDDMPLGNLWFSGLVGGVPRPIKLRPHT